MKKESKSLDGVKNSKVNTDKVHGGKMELPDEMKELDINQVFERDVMPIKRGTMSKGTEKKDTMSDVIRPSETK